MIKPNELPAGGWASLRHWLYYQGVSTVLLVLQSGMIAYVLLKGAPAMWDRHEATVKETRNEFAKANQAQREDLLDANKAQRADLLDANKALRDDFTRTIDRWRIDQ